MTKSLNLVGLRVAAAQTESGLVVTHRQSAGTVTAHDGWLVTVLWDEQPTPVERDTRRFPLTIITSKEY